MGQVTPNGTYVGGSGDTSATLTITDSNSDNGAVNAGIFLYAGRTYNVRGSFHYVDISNDTSAVTFDLDLTPTDGSDSYKLELQSADRNYSNISGVGRLRANVDTSVKFTVSLGKQ